MLDPEMIKRVIAGNRIEIGRVEFYSDHWGLGLPPELRGAIDRYVSKHEHAQWAKEQAIDSIAVRLVETEYISEEKAYDLIVTLTDEDYVYWRLKYDTRL